MGLKWVVMTKSRRQIYKASPPGKYMTGNEIAHISTM